MATKRRNKMAKVDPQSILGGKISFKEREFKFSDKQQKILECLLSDETKIVFLSGCSGTSKTYLAIYAALHLLDKDFQKDIIYIRTIQESGSKSLGSLPGDQGLKFSPFQIPLEEKCEEILAEHSAKQLFAEEKLKAIPVNFLRGSSLKNKLVILDEFQNFSRREGLCALSRIGEGTKYFVCGDTMQSDLAQGKSGFSDYIKAFDDEEAREKGIFHFHFTEEDVVRSEILKFIINRIETKIDLSSQK